MCDMNEKQNFLICFETSFEKFIARKYLNYDKTKFMFITKRRTELPTSVKIKLKIINNKDKLTKET